MEPLSTSFQKLIGGPIQKSAHISARTIANELKFGHKIDYNLLQLKQVTKLAFYIPDEPGSENLKSLFQAHPVCRMLTLSPV
jgi:hypothetical protein